MSKSFRGDIEKLTKSNTYYRKVIHTVPNSMQLVLMSLKPGEEIGEETHPHISQFIRVEKGRGVAYVGRKKYILKNDVAIIIPKGTKHNVINTSKKSDLKLYTIYCPPEHRPGKKEKMKS